MSETKFIFHDQVVYDCQNSGDCCRTDWIIGIDDISYERVRNLEWDKVNTEVSGVNHYQKLKKPLPSGEKMTFARTGQGECIFLNKDCKCQMHQHFGFSVKPQVCKEFPYYFMETPEGIVVGLSFACHAVRNRKGRILREKTDEVKEVYEGSYRVRKFPDNPELYPGISLSWNEYKVLEECLLLLFKFDRPISQILLAGKLLVGEVALSLREVETTAMRKGTLPEETLVGGIKKLISNNGQALFRIAEKMKSSPRLSMSFMAPLYTWLYFVKDEPGRFNLVFKLYCNYFKFRKNRGLLKDVISNDPLISPINLDEVNKIVFDDSIPEIDKFLKQYWCHVVFRKNLFTDLSVFRGYQSLLCFYGFLKWDSKVRAWRNGRSIVNFEDVQNSVKLLEQRFILHSQFQKVYSISPALSIVLDRLYMRKDFAPSVVLEKRK